MNSTTSVERSVPTSDAGSRVRSVEGIHRSTGFHWVGNGFHVSTYFPSAKLAVRARQPLRLDGLRARQGIHAARARQARRRLAPAPRLRDGDARLGRRGRAPRQRGSRGDHRPRRRAVDDGRRRHLPRGVPRGRVHAARRAHAHDAALGEPPAEGQDGAARLPAHHAARQFPSVPLAGRRDRARHRRRVRRGARPGPHVHADHDARRASCAPGARCPSRFPRATTRWRSSPKGRVRAGDATRERGRAGPLRERRRAPRARRRRRTRTSSSSPESRSTSRSSSTARSS